MSQEGLVEKMNYVLSTLRIDAKCVAAMQKRHLMFFDLELRAGARVSKIESFSQEISLLLQSKTDPIFTLIREKGILRVTVAVDNAPTIPYYELLDKTEVGNGLFPVLIGETDSGEPAWVDIAKMPHMLVAGSTGSGKSTFLHVLIANAIDRDDVDLYLCDPKMGVEFGIYSKKVRLAKSYNETLNMLKHLQETMEGRYNIMERIGIRSIEQAPGIFKKNLIIIDEVADLMIADSDKKNPNRGEFEKLVCRLASKARAAGIYIILATQRPSTDVITGLIKANFPARLACKVTSGIDSKVILDQYGAESLLGRGDAILVSPGHDFVRLQIAFVDPEKVAA